jgi:hypothetical protein
MMMTDSQCHWRIRIHWLGIHLAGREAAPAWSWEVLYYLGPSIKTSHVSSILSSGPAKDKGRTLSKSSIA